MRAGPEWTQWTAWLGWPVLAAGLALSALSYSYVHTRTQEAARSSFEEECREIHRAIESRLNNYAGLLLGLRGMHKASGGLTLEAFRAYVRNLGLEAQLPAVQAINYAEEVRPAQREALQRRIRNEAGIGTEAYAGFAIQPGSAASLHVLLYIEPLRDDARLLGRDLRISWPRPDLFDEMSGGGDLVSSGELIAGIREPTLPLRLAVYRRNAIIEDHGQRREGFVGSVGVGISLERLVRESVSASSLNAVRIKLHNAGRAGPDASQRPTRSKANLLIDTASMVPSLRGNAIFEGELLQRPLSAGAQLVFGGALLQLSCAAFPNAFLPPINQLLPVLVLAAGVVISLLLFGAVNSLARTRRSLQAAVSSRTRNLESTNRALQQEMLERYQLERDIFHLNVEMRQRFGTELHDGIAQQLTAIGFHLESLAADLKQRWSEGAELASRIGAHVSTAIAHTRMLARGLNPIAVEAGGLAEALRRLVAATQETFQIECRMFSEGAALAGEAVLEHNLYRICQQAITNAITHGGASRIDIQLSNTAQGLRLAIVDNGVGFGPTRARPSPGIGLQIMRYRCSVLGLEMKIEPVPGGGAAIVIERRASK